MTGASSIACRWGYRPGICDLFPGRGKRCICSTECQECLDGFWVGYLVVCHFHNSLSSPLGNFLLIPLWSICLLGWPAVPQYVLSSHLTFVYCFEVISSSKILGSHRGFEEDYSLVGCEAVLLGDYCSCVLKCCTACIFSVIYSSPSHFCWLATHTCRPLPALTLPGQHTVFVHKSCCSLLFAGDEGMVIFKMSGTTCPPMQHHIPEIGILSSSC
jgi:hypothetical protein